MVLRHHNRRVELTTMFQATRNFVNRNRKGLAVGFGLIGAGYIAVQYVGNKFSEARNRMMSERVAKEKYGIYHGLDTSASHEH